MPGTQSPNDRFTWLLPFICLTIIIFAPLLVTGLHFTLFKPIPNNILQAKIQLALVAFAGQTMVWMFSCLYLAANRKVFIKYHVSLLRHRRNAFLFLGPPLPFLAFWMVYPHLQSKGLIPNHLDIYNVSLLKWFGAAGLVVAGWAIWQMYLIRSIAGTDENVRVDNYLELRDEAHRLLLIAAVVLALGVIQGAALRSAVNASEGQDYFPAEYVIVYAVYFSIILLVAYIPVHFSLVRVGIRLREGLYPAANSAKDLESAKLRQSANETLGLDLNAASLLGPALSTLLPLLSGWITYLLGAK